MSKATKIIYNIFRYVILGIFCLSCVCFFGGLICLAIAFSFHIMGGGSLSDIAPPFISFIMGIWMLSMVFGFISYLVGKFTGCIGCF